MNGFDDCIIGVVRTAGQEPRLLYDTEKVIENLIQNSTMTEEEAWEYHEYNQAGAFVGETTPAFLERYSSLEEIMEALDE